MKEMVTIVGCGSLGGAIVDLLARESYSTGYCLIDPARMESKDLKRHVLDEIGIYKVRGLGNHLHRISTCKTFEMMIDFAFYPYSDLVVCTVDSEECASLVNEHLEQDGTTGVFVSMCGGGKFGRIQVVKPDFPSYNSSPLRALQSPLHGASTDAINSSCGLRPPGSWGSVLIVAAITCDIITHEIWRPLTLVSLSVDETTTGITSVRIDDVSSG